MRPVETIWICGECLEDWTNKTEAKYCCGGAVEPIAAEYVCGACGADYEDEAEAIRCCHTDPSMVLLVSPEELEAAGQTRLFK